MATEHEIQQALALLDRVEMDGDHPPAIVVMAPESGDFILGNRDGFVRLAAASLRASLGEEQSFEKKDWVIIEDLDWGISGLKPDSSAHIYLPVKRTRLQKLWNSAWGFLLVLLLVIFIFVGFIASVRWVLHVS